MMVIGIIMYQTDGENLNFIKRIGTIKVILKMGNFMDMAKLLGEELLILKDISGILFMKV